MRSGNRWLCYKKRKVMFNIKLYDFSPKSGLSLYEIDLFFKLNSLKNNDVTHVPGADAHAAQLICVTKGKGEKNGNAS